MVRIKHRYIIFQIKTLEDYNPDKETLIKSLFQPFLNSYGDFGIGNVFSNLKLIVWDPINKIGIFRILRNWAKNFQNFLESQNTFGTNSLKYIIPHISGTIDQAQNWLNNNKNFF